MNKQISLSEADIKKAVEDRLQIEQNQGKLMFLRLQSGELIVVAGETRRRIKLCPPDTADFVVFQGAEHSVTYHGQQYKPIIPILICRVTFIELKTSTGKQTKEQREFQWQVERLHCRYVVIRDAEQLDEVLK